MGGEGEKRARPSAFRQKNEARGPGKFFSGAAGHHVNAFSWAEDWAATEWRAFHALHNYTATGILPEIRGLQARRGQKGPENANNNARRCNWGYSPSSNVARNPTSAAHLQSYLLLLRVVSELYLPLAPGPGIAAFSTTGSSSVWLGTVRTPAHLVRTHLRSCTRYARRMLSHERHLRPTCSRVSNPATPRTQIAQYTCVYDALHRTVQCKPFVRTFVKQANGLLSEVTPFVNAGRSLPRAGLDVPPGARSERYVRVSLVARCSW